MKFRWIDGQSATDEEWDKVEQILATRGWMSLNKPTTRIRVAEDEDGNLRGFYVLQLAAHAEPLWVAPSERGTGLADRLADDMMNFLIDEQARGWFIVADSPVAVKMCEARGMYKVQSPVYVMGEKV